MTARIATILAALALSLGGLIAAPAQAATCYYNALSTAYNTDWSKSYQKAGTRICYTETTPAGWVYAPVQDKYLHSAGPTQRPNMGGARGTWPRVVADRARRMAAAEGVTLQFARTDLSNRGCFWNNTPSGAYMGDGIGRGLIRLGNSGRASCNSDLAAVLTITAHELGHAWIDRRCGRTDPPMSGPRAAQRERVTSVLGYLHFQDEARALGGRVLREDGWTRNDIYRAQQLLAGNCG
jgi:hypothetical protein